MVSRVPNWIFLVASVLIVAVVVGFLSYKQQVEASINIVKENLRLNHQLSRQAIVVSLETAKIETQLLAENPVVIDFASNDQGNGTITQSELQKFNEWAVECKQHFDFYDLLVINTEGDVIFTVAKESDLGTNLLNGKFKDSGLGNLFRSVRESKEFMGSEFSVYAPSNGELAGFLGAPILLNDKLIGVLAIQIPTSFIKLNIGVHLKGISDYMVTTHYIFQYKGSFRPLLDTEKRKYENQSTVIINDSLFHYTPFKIENLSWGILSIAPPVVIENNIHWLPVFYHVLVAVLIVLIVGVSLIFWLFDRNKKWLYAEDDIILVQNTWKQFSKLKKQFGQDFYYRVKNKINLNLVEGEKSIGEIGKYIEKEIWDVVDHLDDEKNIKSKAESWATACVLKGINDSTVLKLPALYLESYEDELGRTLPFRAKLSWSKVLNTMAKSTAQKIKLNKNKMRS